MALMMRQKPRRGISAGAAKVSTAKVSYTVVKTISNAMKIAGKRRQKGDVFEANPRHVHFLLLEGIIAPTPATGAAASAPAAPAAAAATATSAGATDSASASSSASTSSTTSATKKASS